MSKKTNLYPITSDGCCIAHGTLMACLVIRPTISPLGMDCVPPIPIQSLLITVA
ncbi:Hypothetical predicted protein [Pelobates cultripes]|uniref:Uncharacterized protein n=1 Tax=Pelobates cultripes TaxID=61616 RepID=A0AAD1R8P8_PELCU|nr:Hypothetical predicted protein [Pelobates cultripes]